MNNNKFLFIEALAQNKGFCTEDIIKKYNYNCGNCPLFNSFGCNHQEVFIKAKSLLKEYKLQELLK